MTFLDYFRRVANPMEGAHNAPSQPVNRAQQRRNRINPRLPAPGESFGAYTRRVGQGDRTLARTANTGEALANEQTDSQTATGARAIDRADRASMQTPGQELTAIAARGRNSQNMRLTDIPMGVESAFPKMASGDTPTRGGDYVSGARYDQQGMPTELTTDSINWDSPSRRQGVIAWGVDLRRPERDVLGDVERVAGAPEGLLNMISLRESDLSRGRRQYDQSGPDSTSAQGPHQFTGPTFKTWLNGTGPQYGISANGMTREEMLEMRYDIRVSGAMTAEMARYHAALIQNDNPDGPSASPAEIYLMHHGGEEALALVNAVRRGDDSGFAGRYYPADRNRDGRSDAVQNHMRDYYINGDPNRPRTARQFFDWMTGNTPDSPHRRNYRGQGLEGLPTTPVAFGARADGTSDVATVVTPGVVRLERSAQ